VRALTPAEIAKLPPPAAGPVDFAKLLVEPPTTGAAEPVRLSLAGGRELTLPVSMPIAWTSMRQDVRGKFFNVRNVPGILSRRKTDPWADYEKARQQITAAARKAVGGR